MQELPLFSLPHVVLFPGELLAIHIFEYKYQRMLEALSKGDRRFGIINVLDDSRVAEVGCTAEIVQMEQFPDGRANIIAQGLERFTLVEEINSGDHPRALISIFEESSELFVADSDVNVATSLLFEVIELSARLRRVSITELPEVPKQAKELSFWIGTALPSAPAVRQKLLQMNDTSLRIAYEISILSELRNQLRALLAIDSVFENVH